eukprot:TRINITY_DN67767_c0_g1_i1.p2 TRINITY_DN67767_c0_g1~~TRINITY_DN67767_c0_g1_i1.p2  ORF type:complete len:108 (+),score=26.31 TRINITY_DN67767_c0_g1_i1:54-377(+)
MASVVADQAAFASRAEEKQPASTVLRKSTLPRSVSLAKNWEGNDSDPSEHDSGYLAGTPLRNDRHNTHKTLLANKFSSEPPNPAVAAFEAFRAMQRRIENRNAAFRV